MAADFGPLFVRFGKEESSFFEAFVPDGETIIVPIQEFESIAAFAAKDEQIARERILAQMLLDQTHQGVEALAHVGRQGAQENAARQGQVQHEGSSKRRTSLR